VRQGPVDESRTCRCVGSMHKERQRGGTKLAIQNLPLLLASRERAWRGLGSRVAWHN
jgi:hypothetical protein